MIEIDSRNPIASTPTIGIIGGMGPHAGLALASRVLDWTRAAGDQDHVPIALLSFPGAIDDRSGFLRGTQPRNPGHAIARIALQLHALGARVVAMPCNTAHAPRILEPVLERMAAEAQGTEFVHLIEETALRVREVAPGASRVGLLATEGTYGAGLYSRALRAQGMECVIPDPDVRSELVHRAIYDPEIGLKAFPSPPRPEATRMLNSAISHLAQKGAECIILGCTELSLAFDAPEAGGLRLIDSLDALARGLLRRTYPERLR